MAYVFHFAPATGWMNDPNGLIHHAGRHHLFFQYNPYAATFGQIHWGHASSPDLLAWTEHPIALTPGDRGSYDADGCWSGCAVKLPDGRVAMVYSGHRDHRQLPCVATSDHPALDVWVKSEHNPVIPQWPAIEGITDFRDHAVIPVGDRLRQVIAVGGEHGGQLVSYLSDGWDLTTWELEGTVLAAADFDLPGDTWECPDVAEIDGQAVVILSYYANIGTPAKRSDVLWLTGTMEEGRFTPQRYGRLDTGDRLYAPQSYLTDDGRRVLVGWVRTHLDPAAVGKSSVGAMSLPRVLSVVNGALRQTAPTELDGLIGVDVGMLTAKNPKLVLDDGAGCAIELTVSAGASPLSAVCLEIASAEGERSTYDLGGFTAPSTWTRSDGRWVSDVSEPHAARILFDRGIVEMLFDDGRTATVTAQRFDEVQEICLRNPSLGGTTPDDVTVRVRTLVRDCQS